MPLEIKEILTSLGIDVEPEKLTADEFKTQVGEKYLLKDSVLKDPEVKKKITGQVLGGISTSLARDLGLTSGEIKDKTVEEIVGIYKTKVLAEIEKLKEEGGKNNDKKVEDLTKKIGEFEAKLKTKDDGLKEWEDKYNKEIAERDNNLKSFKLKSVLAKVKEGLASKFTDEYTQNELVRNGFEAYMDNTYVFDLDERDNTVVKLKADGSVVKSKKTIGHNATAEEVFEMEMDAKKVLKKNNATNQKQITNFAKPIEGQGDGKSKAHPNAQKNLERLQSQKKS